MLLMKVRIKKLHKDAIIPRYAKEGDAGLDLVAISKSQQYDIMTYKTGLSIEIPEGYVGLIYPRSSIFRTDLRLSNSVGVIDSGYRGEIILNFNISIDDKNIYQIGDKIAQLIIIPYPQIEFEEVRELSETERGEAGFGSSGK